MTCEKSNEYGHGCTLEDDHGPNHVCECGDEWYVDGNGETIWVTK